MEYELVETPGDEDEAEAGFVLDHERFSNRSAGYGAELSEEYDCALYIPDEERV